MKLNYTSLQHPVEPVEVPHEDAPAPRPARRIPVLVLSLHGQLAPAAWAAARAAPGPAGSATCRRRAARCRARSRATSRELRERGLLCGHVTAGPAHGGEARGDQRRRARCTRRPSRSAGTPRSPGPGPGILGSATALGHGGMAALDSAHAALALGLPTLLAPRLSSAATRARATAASATTPRPCCGCCWRRCGSRSRRSTTATGRPATRAGGETALDRLREACGDRHDVWVREVALDEYAASGLPTTTMGRELAEDRLFFAAALAAGDALGALAAAEMRLVSERRQDELEARSAASSSTRGRSSRSGWTRFEYPDGSTDTRQVVVHPGAVAIVAHDGSVLYMVRQPREPVGGGGAAGAARRQARQGGRDAAGVRPARAGGGDRQVGRRLARAEELLHQPRVRDRAGATCSWRPSSTTCQASPSDDERIEIVRVPLDELDAAIERLPRREVAGRAADAAGRCSKPHSGQGAPVAARK